MEQLGECHFVDDGKMQDANPYTPKNGVLVPQQAMFTYAETSKLVATAVAFHEGVNAAEDNLIVGVCFIPITYLVIILFLAGATVLRVPHICSCTLKKLFCFSFHIFPRKDVANLCLCPQLLQLPISFPPNEFEISFRLAMH